MAGTLLGIGPLAGVGFVTDLWEAALELSPEGDFSGCILDPGVLVAAAGGIPPGTSADPGGVVSILQRVGLISTLPELRVRGLDRYQATWRKNRKLGTLPPGSRGETGGKPARKTESKTETYIDTSKDPSPGNEGGVAQKPRSTDPRHAPLVGELTRIFRTEIGEDYPFNGRDAKAVTDLLGLGIETTIVSAWTNALRSSAFPKVRTLSELTRNFAHFIGRRASQNAKGGDDTEPGVGAMAATELKL